MTALEQPSTILIAALGGEGGGVLSQWLTDALVAAGYPVQGTSIPGVAQRTGATTYYIEFLPLSANKLSGASPVFALTPMPGAIDLMVASELLEAGRAMQNGFVNPDRTTLIASTHRMYAINERASMTDGRVDPARILSAASEIAKQPIFFDINQTTAETGSVASAVMLGAIAGSGAVPVSRKIFEQVIRESGIAVESNLAGFTGGFDKAQSAVSIPTVEDLAKRPTTATAAAQPLLDRVRGDFPKALHELLGEGIARLVDYQDARYAGYYLDRLYRIQALDGPNKSMDEPWLLTREVARYLATWMAFEDVIRVADLKTRAARVARVRKEVGAKAHEPVEIIDYLKPGPEEFTAILPPTLGRPILRWAERRKSPERLHVGLHVKTTTISGFLLMWMLGRMRWARRSSLRYRDENMLQDRWLTAVSHAVERDYQLAVEIARCACLIKGYGSTYHRGQGNFLRIFDTIVEPMVSNSSAMDAAEAVRNVREAALADADGKMLNEALGAAATATTAPRRETSSDSAPQGAADS